MPDRPVSIVDGKIWFPIKHVDMDATRDLFTRRTFDDRMCMTAGDGDVCPERPSRPTSVCEECPGYTGLYKFYDVKRSAKGRRMAGFARGRMDIVRKCVKIPVNTDHFHFVRKTCAAGPGDAERLKFTGRLRPHQIQAVRDLIRRKRGLLIAPPRTGKTVMAVAAVCDMNMRTLILTHQDDLLDQFMTTFRSMTNLEALEDDGLVPVVKAFRRQDMIEMRNGVVLATYQKFLSVAGRADLKAVASSFACVIVDEVHRGNADGYAGVLSRMRPERFYGLTATRKRKDGKEFIVDFVIGPVIAESSPKELVPEVEVRKSAMTRKTTANNWQSIMKAICRDPDRNMGIVKAVVADVKAGHSVVVPVTFRWYAEALVEEINRLWLETTDGVHPIAECFYRYPKDEDRAAVLDRARAGKTRVTVAMRSMLLGINCPPWSALHMIVPANNRPNTEQESKRVCTPHKGKREPRIRLWVDPSVGASVACAKATLRHFQTFGYSLVPGSWQVLDSCDAGPARGHQSRYTGFHGGPPPITME